MRLKSPMTLLYSTAASEANHPIAYHSCQLKLEYTANLYSQPRHLNSVATQNQYESSLRPMKQPRSLAAATFRIVAAQPGLYSELTSYRQTRLRTGKMLRQDIRPLNEHVYTIPSCVPGLDGFVLIKSDSSLIYRS